RRVRRTWLALGVAATALAALFVISVLVKPVLPQLNLRQSAHMPHATDACTQPTPNANATAEERALSAANVLKQTLQTTKVVPARRSSQIKVTPPPDTQAQGATNDTRTQVAQSTDAEQTQRADADVAQTQDATDVRSQQSDAQSQVLTPAGRPLAVGFYVNWDDSSYASLKRNLNELDWLVPEWIRLQDGDDPLVRDFAPKALDLVRRERPSMPILPLVQNYQNEQWNPQLLARAVATEQSRQRLINALLQTVDENKFRGVTIDLEEVPASSQSNLYRFMEELYSTFHQRGLIVAQAVPFDNSDWNYRAYEATTDYLMLMAYDQHWASSAPGSVASQTWFEQLLARRMRELDPSKTIVCVEIGRAHV